MYTARYGPYAGRDIAVAGIQSCAGSRYDAGAERGLMLWDVTTPTSPVQLGYLRTACCTRGVHAFEVQHRADLGRTFADATVPTSRHPDAETASGVRDENGDGDFRLIDITDPAAPRQVSDWGIQDAGDPFTAGQGCDPDASYGHGAEPTDDGRQVFLSYWDSGFIKLDLTYPTRPMFLGRTTSPANADGDAHSSQYDEARRLLFTADEDFCKTSGSGQPRQSVAARGAHEHDAGVGRRRRRGDGPRLRQRHELGALDPAPDADQRSSPTCCRDNEHRDGTRLASSLPRPPREGPRAPGIPTTPARAGARKGRRLDFR